MVISAISIDFSANINYNISGEKYVRDFYKILKK